MSYSYSIPFSGTHGSIVIGKKGRCIKNLKDEFGVEIRSMVPLQCNSLPYFLVEGEERQVHLAALKVFSLLSQSQARAEKHLRDDNAEMVTMIHDLNQENDELKTENIIDKPDELCGIGCSKCYACISGGTSPCQTLA
jgi:hypothetical protein